MATQPLRDEVSGDPLAIGYSGMTDAQLFASLHGLTRSRNRTELSASEVFNAIDEGELNGLTAENRLKIFDLLHMGTLNPFGLEQAIFVGVFGGGSATITALATARVEAISRVTELGNLGDTSEGAIHRARL